MEKNRKPRQVRAEWDEPDLPPVDLDPRDDRFEVEMARRLNEMAAPGWWDG